MAQGQYYFDSRIDSPRPRLADVLAPAGVAGGGAAPIASAAGAVRSTGPGNGLGEGLQSFAANFLNARAQEKQSAAQDKALADADADKAKQIQARIDYLVGKGIPADRAESIANDAGTFGVVVQELDAPPAKPETYEVGGKLYERAPDGTLKLAIDAGSEQDQTIAAYNAAVAAGTFTGTLDEYARLGKSGGTTVNVGDGKLNEGQSKDVGFYESSLYANDIINGQGKALMNPAAYAAGDIPLIGNYLVPADYRQAKKAADEWINTIILRRDSGATINPDEYKKYWSTYMPEPNDDATTLAEKAKRRQIKMDGIKSGLGNQKAYADDAEEKFNQYKIEQQQAADEAAAGGTTPPAADGSTPPPKKNPVYNPATGEFE